MKEDPFSKIASNSSPLTKKGLLGLYAASVFFTVAGLICIYNQVSDNPLNTARLLVDIAITLFGITLGLCVYFRHLIPARVKFYSLCLVSAIGGIWMAMEPKGDYRYSPEFIRLVGVAGALFFGAGGLYVLYKDLRFHYEHRDEQGEANEEKTLTDGVIRFNTNNETEIMEAFDKFDFQGSQKEFPKTRVVQRGIYSLLVLHNIDYSDFCFLFNWLVYRKAPIPDYSLRGWLKEPHLRVKGNAIVAPIMLYIPTDDKEYDNVYFVTSLCNYYKQEFANAQRLHEIDTHPVSYESYPEYETIT